MYKDFLYLGLNESRDSYTYLLIDSDFEYMIHRILDKPYSEAKALVELGSLISKEYEIRGLSVARNLALFYSDPFRSVTVNLNDLIEYSSKHFPEFNEKYMADVQKYWMLT